MLRRHLAHTGCYIKCLKYRGGYSMVMMVIEDGRKGKLIGVVKGNCVYSPLYDSIFTQSPSVSGRNCFSQLGFS